MPITYKLDMPKTYQLLDKRIFSNLNMFLIKLGEVRVFNHNIEFFLKPLAGVPKICRVTNFSIFKNVRIPCYAAAQRVLIVHGRVETVF
jgi:hypothetical protein